MSQHVNDELGQLIYNRLVERDDVDISAHKNYESFRDNVMGDEQKMQAVYQAMMTDEFTMLPQGMTYSEFFNTANAPVQQPEEVQEEVQDTVATGGATGGIDTVAADTVAADTVAVPTQEPTGGDEPTPQYVPRTEMPKEMPLGYDPETGQVDPEVQNQIFESQVEQKMQEQSAQEEIARESAKHMRSLTEGWLPSSEQQQGFLDTERNDALTNNIMVQTEDEELADVERRIKELTESGYDDLVSKELQDVHESIRTHLSPSNQEPIKTELEAMDLRKAAEEDTTEQDYFERVISKKPLDLVQNEELNKLTARYNELKFKKAKGIDQWAKDYNDLFSVNPADEGITKIEAVRKIRTINPDYISYDKSITEDGGIDFKERKEENKTLNTIQNEIRSAADYIDKNFALMNDKDIKEIKKKVEEQTGKDYKDSEFFQAFGILKDNSIDRQIDKYTIERRLDNATSKYGFNPFDEKDDKVFQYVKQQLIDQDLQYAVSRLSNDERNIFNLYNRLDGLNKKVVTDPDNKGQYMTEIAEVKQQIENTKGHKSELYNPKTGKFINMDTATEEEQREATAYEALIEKDAINYRLLGTDILVDRWQTAMDKLKYYEDRYKESWRGGKIVDDPSRPMQGRLSYANYTKNQAINVSAYDVENRPANYTDATRAKAKLYKEGLDNARRTFDGLNRALLNNEDPVGIETWSSGFDKIIGGTGTVREGLGGWFNDIAENMAEGFGVEDIKSDADFAKTLYSELEKGGVRLNNTQKEILEDDISSAVAEGIGTSIPIMVDIIGTSLLTRNPALVIGKGVALSNRVTRVLRVLMAKKWGKAGRVMYHGTKGALTGAISFGAAGEGIVSQGDQVTAAMGVGEGAVGEILYAFNVGEKLAGKYGKLFSAIVTTGAKVAGGTSVEVAQEYAGEFTHELERTGFDWRTAAERTFGENSDVGANKLTITALVSLTFASAFNIKAVGHILKAMRAHPKVTQSQLEAVEKLEAEVRLRQAEGKVPETFPTPKEQQQGKENVADKIGNIESDPVQQRADALNNAEPLVELSVNEDGTVEATDVVDGKTQEEAAPEVQAAPQGQIEVEAKAKLEEEAEVAEGGKSKRKRKTAPEGAVSVAELEAQEAAALAAPATEVTQEAEAAPAETAPVQAEAAPAPATPAAVNTKLIDGVKTKLEEAAAADNSKDKNKAKRSADRQTVAAVTGKQGDNITIEQAAAIQEELGMEKPFLKKDGKVSGANILKSIDQQGITIDQFFQAAADVKQKADIAEKQAVEQQQQQELEAFQQQKKAFTDLNDQLSGVDALIDEGNIDEATKVIEGVESNLDQVNTEDAAKLESLIKVKKANFPKAEKKVLKPKAEPAVEEEAKPRKKAVIQGEIEYYQDQLGKLFQKKAKPEEIAPLQDRLVALNREMAEALSIDPRPSATKSIPFTPKAETTQEAAPAVEVTQEEAPLRKESEVQSEIEATQETLGKLFSEDAIKNRKKIEELQDNLTDLNAEMAAIKSAPKKPAAKATQETKTETKAEVDEELTARLKKLGLDKKTINPLQALLNKVRNDLNVGLAAGAAFSKFQNHKTALKKKMKEGKLAELNPTDQKKVTQAMKFRMNQMLADSDYEMTETEALGVDAEGKPTKGRGFILTEEGKAKAAKRGEQRRKKENDIKRGLKGDGNFRSTDAREHSIGGVKGNEINAGDKITLKKDLVTGKGGDKVVQAKKGETITIIEAIHGKKGSRYKFIKEDVTQEEVEKSKKAAEKAVKESLDPKNTAEITDEKTVEDQLDIVEKAETEEDLIDPKKRINKIQGEIGGKLGRDAVLSLLGFDAEYIAEFKSKKLGTILQEDGWFESRAKTKQVWAAIKEFQMESALAMENQVEESTKIVKEVTKAIKSEDSKASTLEKTRKEINDLNSTIDQKKKEADQLFQDRKEGKIAEKDYISKRAELQKEIKESLDARKKKEADLIKDEAADTGYLDIESGLGDISDSIHESRSSFGLFILGSPATIKFAAGVAKIARGVAKIAVRVGIPKVIKAIGQVIKFPFSMLEKGFASGLNLVLSEGLFRVIRGLAYYGIGVPVFGSKRSPYITWYLKNVRTMRNTIREKGYFGYAKPTFDQFKAVIDSAEYDSIAAPKSQKLSTLIEGIETWARFYGNAATKGKNEATMLMNNNLSHYLFDVSKQGRKMLDDFNKRKAALEKKLANGKITDVKYAEEILKIQEEQLAAYDSSISLLDNHKEEVRSFKFDLDRGEGIRAFKKLLSADKTRLGHLLFANYGKINEWLHNRGQIVKKFDESLDQTQREAATFILQGAESLPKLKIRTKTGEEIDNPILEKRFTAEKHKAINDLIAKFHGLFVDGKIDQNKLKELKADPDTKVMAEQLVVIQEDLKDVAQTLVNLDIFNKNILDQNYFPSMYDLESTGSIHEELFEEQEKGTMKQGSSTRFVKPRKYETLTQGIESTGALPANLDAGKVLAVYYNGMAKYVGNLNLAKSLIAHPNTIGKPLAVIVNSPKEIAKLEMQGYKLFDGRALQVVVKRKGKGQAEYALKPIAVHKEIYSTIDNFVQTKFEERSGLEKINNIFKRNALTFSFFHNIALTETAMATPDVFIRSIKEGANPLKLLTGFTEQDFIALQNDPLFKDAVEHGLVVDISPDQMRETAKKMRDQAETWLEKAMENSPVTINSHLKGWTKNGTKAGGAIIKRLDEFLWDYMHNNYKLIAYEVHVAKVEAKLEEGYRGWFRKNKKFTDKQKARILTRAKREIASQVNNTYGGQAWQLQGMPDGVLKIAQLALLSPDWTVSTFKQFMSPFAGFMHTKPARLMRINGEKGDPVASTLTKIGDALDPALYRDTAWIKRNMGWRFVSRSVIYGYGMLMAANYATTSGWVMGIAPDEKERDIDPLTGKKKKPLSWDEIVALYDKEGIGRNLIGEILTKSLGVDRGKMPWENDDGRLLSLYIGYRDDQHKRYVNPFKQMKEVPHLYADFSARVGSKASPAIQIVSQALTGHTFMGGFRTFKNEEGDVPSILQRLAISTGQSFFPFSAQGYIRELFNQGYYDEYRKWYDNVIGLAYPVGKSVSSDSKFEELMEESVKDGNVFTMEHIIHSAMDNNLWPDPSYIKRQFTAVKNQFEKDLLKEKRRKEKTFKALNLIKADGTFDNEVKEIWERSQEYENQLNFMYTNLMVEKYNIDPSRPTAEQKQQWQDLMIPKYYGTGQTKFPDERIMGSGVRRRLGVDE